MINLKAKILTVTLGSSLVLSGLAIPAFAGSTINISSANSNSNSSVNNFGGNFPFGDFKFDKLFSQFFGRNLMAQMDGSQEIPGPGDNDGTGEARVRIKPGKDQICVDIKTKYLDTATAAHIHHAPKGSSGAIVVVLPTPDSSGEAHGCVDVENNLLNAIKDNPQDYYVNVHTSAYPDGAIRGQLSR